MSQLLAPLHTAVDSIPLGRRIAEIMKEKGSAFSTNAMGRRLGISRETIRLMLVGERRIFWYELEKIANDLKVPIDRILQNDIAEDHKIMTDLIAGQTGFERALELAERIKNCAIGSTETCHGYISIARVWYVHRKYDQAHVFLLEAYEYAQESMERFDDRNLLYSVLKRLLNTFPMVEEYDKLSELIEKVEHHFENAPSEQGKICFAKAMIAKHFGNYEAARNYLSESIQHYIRSGNIHDVGRAEHNLGYFEFEMGNYVESKQLFEQAILQLEGDNMKQVAIKDLSRTLIKLGEKEYAATILRNELPFINNPDLKAKYLLLLAVASEDMSYAESFITLPTKLL